MPDHTTATTISVILFASFVSACASTSQSRSTSRPQPTRQIINSSVGVIRIYDEPGTEPRIVRASTGDIWATLPAVFEHLEIPADVVNPQGLEIGTQGYRPRRVAGERLSMFLNCGVGSTGQRADNYEVYMSVATRLTAQTSDSTLVHTTINATAKPRTVSGSTVPCSSRGVLEMRVTQLIVDQLRTRR